MSYLCQIQFCERSCTSSHYSPSTDHLCCLFRQQGFLHAPILPGDLERDSGDFFGPVGLKTNTKRFKGEVSMRHLGPERAPEN